MFVALFMQTFKSVEYSEFLSEGGRIQQGSWGGQDLGIAWTSCSEVTGCPGWVSSCWLWPAACAMQPRAASAGWGAAGCTCTTGAPAHGNPAERLRWFPDRSPLKLWSAINGIFQ